MAGQAGKPRYLERLRGFFLGACGFGAGRVDRNRRAMSSAVIVGGSGGGAGTLCADMRYLNSAHAMAGLGRAMPGGFPAVLV